MACVSWRVIVRCVSGHPSANSSLWSADEKASFALFCTAVCDSASVNPALISATVKRPTQALPASSLFVSLKKRDFLTARRSPDWIVATCPTRAPATRLLWGEAAPLGRHSCASPLKRTSRGVAP